MQWKSMSEFRAATEEERSKMPRLCQLYADFLVARKDFSQGTAARYGRALRDVFSYDGRAPAEMASLDYFLSVKHSLEDTLLRRLHSGTVKHFADFWREKGGLSARDALLPDAGSDMFAIPASRVRGEAAVFTTDPAALRAEGLPSGWRLYRNKDGMFLGWMSPAGHFCITRSEAVLWLTAQEVPVFNDSVGLSAAVCPPQTLASGLESNPSPSKRWRLQTLQKKSSAKSGCVLAEEKAVSLLAENRKIGDSEALQVLDLWSFRKNEARANVIPDGDPYVFSEMLGLVRVRMYCKYTIASQTKRFPNVTRLLAQYLHDNPPLEMPPGDRYQFTTICINKNYAAKRHRDKNNVGISVVKSLGDFTGGRLRYWSRDPGNLVVKDNDVHRLDPNDAEWYDVRERFRPVDGRCAHEVEPFVGQRYSLVFFTVSGREHFPPEERPSLFEKCGITYPEKGVSEAFARRLTGREDDPSAFEAKTNFRRVRREQRESRSIESSTAKRGAAVAAKRKVLQRRRRPAFAHATAGKPLRRRR